MQRKKISFGEKQLAETAETKRDPPPSNQRGKKISEQLWVVPSFSPFFFSVFLFFPTTYCLGLVHPCHFIVSVGGGRPSLIESAVLYLLGPPQPFVCFSPISVALFLSFPHPSLSLSLSSAPTKFSYQRNSCNDPLLSRVTASWLQRSQQTILQQQTGVWASFIVR